MAKKSTSKTKEQKDLEGIKGKLKKGEIEPKQALEDSLEVLDGEEDEAEEGTEEQPVDGEEGTEMPGNAGEETPNPEVPAEGETPVVAAPGPAPIPAPADGEGELGDGDDAPVDVPSEGGEEPAPEAPAEGGEQPEAPAEEEKAPELEAMVYALYRKEMFGGDAEFEKIAKYVHKQGIKQDSK